MMETFKNVIKMKKLIVLIFVIVAPLALFAAKGVELKGEINSLVKKFDSKSEFEVVRLSKLPLSILRAAAERDDQEEMRAIRHIDQLLVVEYEDCRAAVKWDFDTNLSSILAKANLIMEVYDEGDKIMVYGNADGVTIQDLILYIPSESTLVCFFGEVSMNDINLLIEEYN